MSQNNKTTQSFRVVYWPKPVVSKDNTSVSFYLTRHALSFGISNRNVVSGIEIHRTIFFVAPCYLHWRKYYK